MNPERLKLRSFKTKLVRQSQQRKFKPERLIFEGETKFFNHRVRENCARDPLDFSLRLVLRNAAVECYFEIFSLPDILQILIADLGKGAMDGLTLRIQNALL